MTSKSERNTTKKEHKKEKKHKKEKECKESKDVEHDYDLLSSSKMDEKNDAYPSPKNQRSDQLEKTKEKKKEKKKDKTHNKDKKRKNINDANDEHSDHNENKDKKKKKRNLTRDNDGIDTINDTHSQLSTNEHGNNSFIDPPVSSNPDDINLIGGRVVSSSAILPSDTNDKNSTSLLLFYSYIEPPLKTQVQFQRLLNYVESTASKLSITGRSRTAYEGLNCTLTGSYQSIRSFCKALREYPDGPYFTQTEFKITDHLPARHLFPKLHVFKVEELVNYGLTGPRVPSMSYAGVHLEPKDYHLKMMQQDTVIIDVRNHYEANIGKFQPPETGAKYIDPNMRKSTEFPLWLDKPETKEQLRGKTVLMYCTGGVRCERASALLKQKMDLEDDVKELGIKEVYQLQGGIDKYFKEFPEGGWWKGKNYVFDKRFAHAPLAIENIERQKRIPATDIEEQGLSNEEQSETNEKATVEVMGNCEACSKPWDRYRGNRRCPTCGVPSLICRDCYVADANNVKKLGKSVRCDLCVKDNIFSKRQLREREEKEMEEYEKKLSKLYNFEVLSPKDKTHRNRTPSNKTRSNDDSTSKKERIKCTQPAPNPDKITRLFVKNLCVQTVDKEKLCSTIPGITHIKWLTDKESKEWYGSVFLEVDTPENAALAVGTKNGLILNDRKISVNYAKPDPKNVWPPPHSAI